MSIERISAYQVTPHENGSFTTADGSTFDIEAYSLMKFGDAAIGWQYGMDLADSVVERAPDEAMADKVLLTVPACVYSPKPTFSVARGMLTGLNLRRAENGVESAKIMRMYNDTIGDPNYAMFSEADRAKDRATVKQRHVAPSLVEDSVVFTVDDCVITGNTERSQRNILTPFNPEVVISTPAIEVDPTEAAAFPGIENIMNLAANPTLETVSHMIEAGRFSLNSRVLKVILTHPNETELSEFFTACPLTLRQEMYESVVNATLDFLQANARGANILRKALQQG